MSPRARSPCIVVETANGDDDQGIQCSLDRPGQTRIWVPVPRSAPAGDLGATPGPPHDAGVMLRSLLPLLRARGPLILDGGLATQLEALGHDLSSALWSARLLVEDPAAIRAAHRSFFAAGADVAITSSYQVSFGGLAQIGLGPAAVDTVLRRSVTLAREAAEQAARPDALVAASVGPYGAALADGSEYRGDYRLTSDELRAFHQPRMEILADSGADLLAVETIPCAAEVEVILTLLADLDVPAWVSLTCAGDRTRAGEPALEVFEMVADCPQVVAVGINCSSPDDATALVAAAAAVSRLPVAVYPNSGERWDHHRRRWSGGRRGLADLVPTWLAAGAELIGGCCRVSPADITDIAAAVACTAVPASPASGT